MPKWEVVGGADKGGILVREGQDLKSPQAPERLATGSVVDQLELIGDRLHYRLVSGGGQAEGWVSLKLSGKDLLVPKAEEAPKPPSNAETADAEWPAYLAAVHAAEPVTTSLKAAAPWLGSVGKAPGKGRVRLVIFNWTGNRGGAGSMHQFIKWPKMLTEAGSPPDTWEVVQVNYTGRGARNKEPLMSDYDAVTTAVADALTKAGTVPTVLFGFSFGAVLAYETAVKMQAGGQPVLGLVAASAEGPQWPGRGDGQGAGGGATKDMPDEEFEAMLHAKGGTEMILQNPDMKRMHLPTILNDIVLEEAYGKALPAHPTLLNPIVVFRGKACPYVARDLAEGWIAQAAVWGPSRVEDMETGLGPSEQMPWGSDWYLLQGEATMPAIVASIARDFGGAPAA